jgi:hypothetical protein
MERDVAPNDVLAERQKHHHERLISLEAAQGRLEGHLGKIERNLDQIKYGVVGALLLASAQSFGLLTALRMALGF